MMSDSKAKYSEENKKAYWREHLRLLSILLSIWFAVSFGAGVLLVDFFDQFTLLGFKLGFWFSQQGAIYVFVALIFYYVGKMNKLDAKYQFSED